MINSIRLFVLFVVDLESSVALLVAEILFVLLPSSWRSFVVVKGLITLSILLTDKFKFISEN